MSTIDRLSSRSQFSIAHDPGQAPKSSGPRFLPSPQGVPTSALPTRRGQPDFAHAGSLRAAMKVVIVRESRADERRVAATPDTVSRLTKKLGFEVSVEAGAGTAAGFSDAAFAEAGASIAPSGP